MIFHTSLHWLTSNINKSLESQKKLHTSSSQVSYGMSIVRNLEKINHVLMALYCIQVMPSPGHYICSRERLLLSQYSPILVCSVIKSSRIFVSMFASFIATIWKKQDVEWPHFIISWHGNISGITDPLCGPVMMSCHANVFWTRMSRRKRRHLKSPLSLTVSSASRSHSGCLLHQGILLTLIPVVPWKSGLPFPGYDLTLTIQGQSQRYPSQHSIQMTHFLSVSHQGILSTPVPFVPWQSGLPFPRYNLTLKIQGQRSRSKVKVKGTLVSVASSWLISFLFHINWTNHS